MMHFSARLLSCLLAALLGLSACAQIEPGAAQTQTNETGEAKAPVINSPLDAQLMYGILLGEIDFQLGDVGDGAGYLVEAARQSGDEALYQRAADMAIQARSADLALQVTEAWRDAYPGSLPALRYELQVLLASGRIAETRDPLLELLSAGTLPDEEKEALITALPAFYEHARNREEAAELVEDILSDALEQPRFAPAAWTTVGRMRLRAGDATGSLAAAKLGQGADPDSQWPAILALQLMADGPDDLNASAESVVTGYLERPGAEPAVRMGYAQLLLETGRYDIARVQLEQLTQQHPDYAEGWLLIGILDESQRRDPSARQALERYLDLVTAEAADAAGGNPDRARLALSRIAQRSGNDAEALSWLDALDDTASSLQVLAQRADLLARQGKLAQARALIRSAPEHEPAEARMKVMAEARLLRENDHPRQAYELLIDALEEAPDDEDLLYDTAMAAERVGDIGTLERLLRRLIALNPEAAHAYNALGYTLAERGLRLPEAQALIEKAVELAPDDGYIQDSLGWVHYKRGQLQEARDILQAAYTRQPDAEIAAHLGEVLWQMGEHDAARATWAKGSALDPNNQALRETMERLDSAP